MACPWCTMPGGNHDDGCPYGRIAVLEAALRVLSNPVEFPDLRSFHSGVRSVYGQAVYEGRNEMAEWMAGRWPSALTPAET